MAPRSIDKFRFLSGFSQTPQTNNQYDMVLFVIDAIFLGNFHEK